MTICRGFFSLFLGFPCKPSVFFFLLFSNLKKSKADLSGFSTFIDFVVGSFNHDKENPCFGLKFVWSLMFIFLSKKNCLSHNLTGDSNEKLTKSTFHSSPGLKLVQLAKFVVKLFSLLNFIYLGHPRQLADRCVQLKYSYDATVYLYYIWLSRKLWTCTHSSSPLFLSRLLLNSRSAHGDWLQLFPMSNVLLDGCVAYLPCGFVF